MKNELKHIMIVNSVVLLKEDQERKVTNVNSNKFISIFCIILRTKAPKCMQLTTTDISWKETFTFLFLLNDCWRNLSRRYYNIISFRKRIIKKYATESIHRFRAFFANDSKEFDTRIGLCFILDQLRICKDGANIWARGKNKEKDHERKGWK